MVGVVDHSRLDAEVHKVLDHRRKGIGLRLGVACAIAFGFMPVIDWRLCLGWGLAYISLQLLEARWARRAPAPVALGFLGLSSLVFGAFALTGPTENGGWGAAAGFALVCGGFLNIAMGTLKSKIAFIVSFAPFALILALIPFLGWLEGAEVKQAILLQLAGGYVTVMGYLIWKTGADAFKAEEQARARAEMADHAKSAFVAMVSHELRTPINAMLAGAAEAGSAVTDKQRQENLDLITGSARMMRTLLNDLLDLSKIEAGKMSVEQTDFDLSRLIQDCVRLWEPEARKRALGFRVEGADSLPAPVKGDPVRIHQVLNNLFSNAFKFTEQGEVALLIETQAQGDAWVCFFTLADTGKGMTAEQAGRLFTPYAQADASIARTHGGTGLGLSISRELAKLMGGDLSAKSKVGEGSQFTLTLRLSPGVLSQSEPLVQVALDGGLRILAADDHPINRKAVELILAQAADRLVVVADGDEAIEAASLETFDVVLLDLNMERMGGLEAARLLRQTHGNRMRILALTGSVSAADEAACLAAGMNGLIAKPVEPRELLATIAAVLEDQEGLAVADSLVA